MAVPEKLNDVANKFGERLKVGAMLQHFTTTA